MPRKATKTRKAKGQTGKRFPLNIRTTFEIRESLERAAASSGRSLAQELEMRLERSFAAEVGIQSTIEFAFGAEIAAIILLMAEVMKDAAAAAQVFAGKEAGFLDDAVVFYEGSDAVAEVLRAFRPNETRGELAPEQKGALGRMLARGYLEAVRNKDRGGDIATRVQAIRDLLGDRAAHIAVDDSEVWVRALK